MIRRLLLAAALAVPGTCIASAAPAHAALGGCGTSTWCNYVYYSDATRTVPVGSYLIDCNGKVTSGGIVTNFILSHTHPCVL